MPCASRGAHRCRSRLAPTLARATAENLQLHGPAAARTDQLQLRPVCGELLIFVENQQFASHRSPDPRRGAAGGLTQPKARGENGALARARAKSWSAAGREWCRRKKMRTQEAPPCGSSAGSLAGTGVNESAALAGLYYRELYGGCFYEKTGAAEPRVICIEPSKTLKRILRASPNGRTTHG